MHEDYDSSIMTIQNSRLIIKISECDIFSGGNEIDKIPEIFLKERNLSISFILSLSPTPVSLLFSHSCLCLLHLYPFSHTPSLSHTYIPLSPVSSLSPTPVSSLSLSLCLSHSHTPVCLSHTCILTLFPIPVSSLSPDDSLLSTPVSLFIFFSHNLSLFLSFFSFSLSLSSFSYHISLTLPLSPIPSLSLSCFNPRIVYLYL